MLKNMVACIAITGLLTQVSGCGVLLHPERQGQQSGDIDVRVALLDGIGLLFFVVPGLVAFGIDFYQGTIYLPGDSHASTLNGDTLRSIHIEGEMNEEAIEAAILEHAGLVIDLSADNVQAKKITPEQLGMISTIARYNAKQQNRLL